jgi:hypothetical protein
MTMFLTSELVQRAQRDQPQEPPFALAGTKPSGALPETAAHD